MARRDYYDVLGVPRSASEKETGQAYRRRARQYHPDLNPKDKQAETKFKEIGQAYEVLGEADKRKQYDRWGHDFEKIEQARKAGAPTGATRTGGSGPFTWNPGGTTFTGGTGGTGGAGGDDMLGGLVDPIPRRIGLRAVHLEPRWDDIHGRNRRDWRRRR